MPRILVEPLNEPRPKKLYEHLSQSVKALKEPSVLRRKKKHYQNTMCGNVSNYQNSIHIFIYFLMLSSVFTNGFHSNPQRVNTTWFV